jgi:hypothetical protein
MGLALKGESHFFFFPRMRAHYKVFFRCYSCRLARLFDNQVITGDKGEKSLPLVAAKCCFCP